MLPTSDLPPHSALRTARLWLRPLALEDAAAVFAYARDPAVLRHTTGRAPAALAETESFLRALLADPATRAWAIRRGPGEPATGIVEFSREAPALGSVHYALAAAQWGQGVATEAVGAVCAWAFAAQPALARVETSVAPANVGSWRVLEKVGFRRVREGAAQWAKADGPVDLWYYRLTRPGETGAPAP